MSTLATRRNLRAARKTAFPLPVASARALIGVLVMLCGAVAPAVAAGELADAEAPLGEVVVVGGGDAYKPFHFMADGRARGFDVDLIAAVAEAMGLDIEIRLDGWRHIRDGLADGSVDVHVGMTFSQERANQYLFSSPFLSQHYRIFVLEGTTGITTEQDLRGRRIAVQSNGVMADYVLTHGHTDDPILAASAREALQLFVSGDADCIIMPEYRGLQVSQDLALDGVVRVGDPIHPTFHGFAVRKERADLVPLLNQGLALTKKSGEYDRIYAEWFGVLEENPRSTWDYLKYILWIVLPLAFVAMVAALWSWSLHRQVVERTFQLQQARDQAQTASEVKSRFLATMSHEVRTPLNAVMGMTELLDTSELTGIQHEQVTAIRSSATGLQEIIADILAFSRLEQDERNLDREAFSFRDLVTEIMANAEARARRQGLELRSPLPALLPDRVLRDPTAVRRIFIHLLDNAVKFTPVGGIDVSIGHERTADGKLRVTTVVADTGIGIPEEARGGLFDAFTQADSSSTRLYGGTGLGLALCHCLVGAMGGELRYAPGPDGGSTFSFSLLLDPVADAVAEQRTAPDNAGETVLVVEDNLVNQRVVTLLLRKWGFRSEVADSGAEAVEFCRHATYGAIIMDCQMPVMDGLEATVAIRHLEGDGRRTPIIALTAGAAGHDRRTCLAAGMDEYLTKPVDGKRLRASLENLFVGVPAPTAD